ncbi:expressed unknown protein [Seminavis robusta]|uniref:Uncharacterized protein n=1 Tax=Seminavis robusta TaxID=568900 RepID=A0A9N8HFL9_9STRA|nr:expressed unknown protein [Seminavis robusta]|eukprot:Sro579_g170040.1 n/a (186) ;mRNA; r:48220-48777
MRSVVSSSNTNAPYPFASASQEFKTIHEGVDESSRYNNNAAGAFDDLDLEMLNTFEGGNYNTTTTTKVSQSVPSPICSMDNLPDATATCTATQCDVLPGSHNSSGEPTPIDLGGLPIEKKNENANKETQTEIDAEEGNLLPSTERQSPLQGFEETQLQDSTANRIDATNRAELPTNATTRGAEHD